MAPELISAFFVDLFERTPRNLFLVIAYYWILTNIYKPSQIIQHNCMYALGPEQLLPEAYFANTFYLRWGNR